jgi:hypothetical protein
MTFELEFAGLFVAALHGQEPGWGLSEPNSAIHKSKIAADPCNLALISRPFDTAFSICDSPALVGRRAGRDL